MKKCIHKNIFTGKRQLQGYGFTVLQKRDSILDVFVKFVKFYRISILQKLGDCFQIPARLRAYYLL